MAMRKLPRSTSALRKKYCFKIAGCQNPVKKVTIDSKDEEWLKKFFYNN